MNTLHAPVLLQEMLAQLTPHSRGVYLDGTLGAGGYAYAILEASAPAGKVVGLDLDAEAIQRASERLKPFGDRMKAVHGGYHQAPDILEALGIEKIDGAALDLGLSSDQLGEGERGFSIRLDGPLDMRFDTESGQTALEMLRGMSQSALVDILGEYGEERRPRRIASAILDAAKRGQLKTTHDLAELMAKLAGGRRGKIHPATRTFQALRIAVNRELDNLDRALEALPEMLNPGGRLCVVSYHSLEDRRVKLAFRERARKSDRWRVLTPKPIRPGQDEIRSNPRARSARMRTLEALI